MGFVITADLHAHNFSAYAKVEKDGLNSRLKRTVECLDLICETALENKAALIIAGDLFHNQQAVDISVLDSVARVLADYKRKGLHIFLLAGNHDFYIRGTGSVSIAALSGIATVITEPELHGVGGMNVAFIPYTNSRNALRKSVDHLVGATVLVTHVGVFPGKVGPSDFEIPGDVKVSDLRPNDFDWVLMGHYHKMQWLEKGKYGNVLYVGSPLQISWGEAGEEKRFHAVTDNGLVTFENEASPRFVEIGSGEKPRKKDYVRAVASSIREAEKLRSELPPSAVVTVEREVCVTQRLDIAGKNQVGIMKAYVGVNPPPKHLDTNEVVDVGMGFLMREEQDE